MFGLFKKQLNVSGVLKCGKTFHFSTPCKRFAKAEEIQRDVDILKSGVQNSFEVAHDGYIQIGDSILNLAEAAIVEVYVS